MAFEKCSKCNKLMSLSLKKYRCGSCQAWFCPSCMDRYCLFCKGPVSQVEPEE